MDIQAPKKTVEESLFHLQSVFSKSIVEVSIQKTKTFLKTLHFKPTLQKIKSVFPNQKFKVKVQNLESQNRKLNFCETLFENKTFLESSNSIEKV